MNRPQREQPSILFSFPHIFDAVSGSKKNLHNLRFPILSPDAAKEANRQTKLA